MRFMGNLATWREILTFDIKKYIRNGGKCNYIPGKNAFFQTLCLSFPTRCKLQNIKCLLDRFYTSKSIYMCKIKKCVSHKGKWISKETVNQIQLINQIWKDTNSTNKMKAKWIELFLCKCMKYIKVIYFFSQLIKLVGYPRYAQIPLVMIRIFCHCVICSDTCKICF